jgi:NAD(P)-dependent dehydrogenase (short-subunit alcohol dehydrogenase family)
MAVETAQHRADAKADAAADKALSPEAKADKELQEENKKRSEERVKFIDETVAGIHANVEKSGDPKTFVKDVADRVSKTQVIAAGASYGPTPAQMEELTSQEFPIVAPPLPDGTPLANIAQYEPREGVEPQKKSAHGVVEKK